MEDRELEQDPVGEVAREAERGRSPRTPAITLTAVALALGALVAVVLAIVLVAQLLA